MQFTRRALIAFSVLNALAGTAAAQEWPKKQPIRIIVPYPAGGNADSGARAVAEAAGQALKQGFIIDNRPGASSIIGTELIARAQPDGYTIGVVSDSHAINEVLSKLPKSSDVLGARVPYDAVKDFVPVSGMILVPLVMVVHPKIPAKTVKEVVAFSQDPQRQGMNFGTMGPGSPWAIHLHQLHELTGAKFVDVPYKGLAPAATDLLASQIDIMVMPLHYAQQYIQSGKLRPIVTLSEERHPLLPDVPTLAESGYPGFSISNYLYFVAPAGIPAAIVGKLEQVFVSALEQPAMRGKLGSSGDPYPGSSKELAERLRRDIQTYGAVIQKTVK